MQQKQRAKLGGKLPEGLRRSATGGLLAEFQARFPDGQLFSRSKEFAPDALNAAQAFLEKVRAEFARGNGQAPPKLSGGKLTVTGWCRHCIEVAMPPQKSQGVLRYSEATLAGFAQMTKQYVEPSIGAIPLEEINKDQVKGLIHSIKDSADRAQTLYMLTRMFELSESKGRRKKGTNPAKGVSLQRF